ncbi:uncharacterized protein JCM6883_005732 [Sporobolomyces salmoneus]|uniref:uncharacterized protein n=1 Tax=Sporobolomyces salmoneus TaxID=183962 RepID=UPI0031778D15
MERTKKKIKIANAPDTLAHEVPATLHAFKQLDQTLSSSATIHDSLAIQTALSNAGKALSLLESASSVNRDKDGQNEMKQLERLGKQLWNTSRIIEKATTSKNIGADLSRKKLVAKLRHLALRTIKFCINSSATLEEKLLLFELITQTASSYLDISKTNFIKSLETEAASLADSFKYLSNLEPNLRSRSALALLDYLVFRVRNLVHNGNLPIAQWTKGKVDEVLKREEIPKRKLLDLAETFYRISTSFILDPKSNDPEYEKKLAIDWLEWSNNLLDVEKDKSTRALRIAILESLSFAQSQVEEHFKDAEVTQNNLITLEPTFARKRRLLTMILARARGGTDDEILEGYKKLVPDALESEKQGLTHELRFQVIQSLSESVVTSLAVENNPQIASNLGRFLEQLFSISAILVKSSDLDIMSTLFTSAQQTVPDFRLSQTSAFLIATYLQSVTNTKDTSEAVRWTALLFSPPLASLDPAFLAQNVRMIASKLIEAQQYDDAETILRNRSLTEEKVDARIELLRCQIALLRHDSARALEHFNSAYSAANLTIDGLVWLAHQANEAVDANLFRVVLEKIVQVFAEKKKVEGMDSMTAARLCLRMCFEKTTRLGQPSEIEIFQPIFDTLEIARTFVERKSDLPEDFTKSLTWIRLATIETLTKLSPTWSSDSLAQLYETLSSIIEMELATSKPTQEILSNLPACRLASLAARASIIRELDAEAQLDHSSSLLQELRNYSERLVELKQTHPRHIPEIEFNRFFNAPIALQAECHVSLSHWPELLKLVEVIEKTGSSDEFSLMALRMICDSISQNALECPYEILRTIYRKTLTILYQNRVLNSQEMAIWLRMMIQVLIEKESDEAFKYFENAKQLVVNQPDAYPKEEVSWLINIAWDQGIELYSTLAHQPNQQESTDNPQKWFEMAIALAKVANDQLMAQQLEEWYTGLKARGIEDGGGEEGEDGMDQD